MITACPQKKPSLAQYFATPEGVKYQFVESGIIKMDNPTPDHQHIVGKLYLLINMYLLKNPSGKVFIAPLDVKLELKNVYQPAVFFVNHENKTIKINKIVEQAPDLVIGLFSESTAYYDLTIKKRQYAQNGVKEYWVVDGSNKAIKVFKNTPENEFVIIQVFKQDRTLTSTVLQNFKPKSEAVFIY